MRGLLSPLGRYSLKRARWKELGTIPADPLLQLMRETGGSRSTARFGSLRGPSKSPPKGQSQ
jgi:hypothetical protein